MQSRAVEGPRQPESSPSASIWVILSLFVLSTGVLLINIRRYFPFLSDDALISLRYTRRLLDGHGLTWTDGPAVEGYSNLLWVLLVAVPGLFGADLIASARALGILAMLTTIGAIGWWYGTRYSLRIAWFPVLTGQLFLALAAPIAVWAIGGLETPVVAALIAVAVPLTFAKLDQVEPRNTSVLMLSLVLGLLCLTRPDAPMFAAAAAGTLLVIRRSVGIALRVLVMPIVLTAAQLLFRLLYYGELVPNTALVKIAPTRARWAFGWEYVSSGFWALSPFSWLAVCSILLLLIYPRTRGRGLLLFTMAGAWISYLVFVGGDIFPAYRHLVPLVVIFAFALSEAARVVAERLRSRPILIALALLVASLLVSFAERQIADKHSVRAVRERWEWQGKEVALLLKNAFGRQQPLLAVTAAGCLPYWSELPSLDMLGLNDHYLPRHPPADMGTGFLGHELGDARYVLDRRPDLIVFTVGSPPEFRVGQLLAAEPEFQERYVPVKVDIRDLEYVPLIYFNKYSQKLGIITSESTVTIPGYLLTGDRAVAHARADGTLVTSLDSGTAQIMFRIERPLTNATLEVRSSNVSALSSELSQNGNNVTVMVRSESPQRAEIEKIILRIR